MTLNSDAFGKKEWKKPELRRLDLSERQIADLFGDAALPSPRKYQSAA